MKFDETKRQTTEEQRTINCALMLDEVEESQLLLLTPSQYNLLVYMSNEEMDFYNSQVTVLEKNPFKTF